MSERGVEVRFDGLVKTYGRVRAVDGYRPVVGHRGIRRDWAAAHGAGRARASRGAVRQRR